MPVAHAGAGVPGPSSCKEQNAASKPQRAPLVQSRPGGAQGFVTVPATAALALPVSGRPGAGGVRRGQAIGGRMGRAAADTRAGGGVEGGARRVWGDLALAGFLLPGPPLRVLAEVETGQ